MATEDSMDMWLREAVNLNEKFWNRIIGRTIQLTTYFGMYEGVLTSIDTGHAILLSKVKDLKTSQNVQGIQPFKGSDILHVELLQDPEHNTAFGSVTLQTEKPSKNAEKSLPFNIQPGNPTATLEAINAAAEKIDVQYILIDQIQTLFGPAMLHIQSQNVLGVSSAGFNMCRDGKLCWLQVATKSQVYLFDIFTLGPSVFKNGLKMVLEDRGIVKVIHDCRGLSDCLAHQYGIGLSNVFDTQVADVFLFSVATGGFLPHCTCTVDECLKSHLNLTSPHASFLSYKGEIAKETPDVWITRPLPVSLMKLLALEVVYLCTLRFAMLEAMMTDFTCSVERYLNIHKRSAVELQNGCLFPGSVLPEELRELSVLQETRQKMALEKFEVNDMGLLMRLEEKLITPTENGKLKQELMLPFSDELCPAERKGLPRLGALPKQSGKTNQSAESQMSPKKEEFGVKAHECSVSVDTSGTTAQLLAKSLQKTSQCRNKEGPVLGLENLHLTSYQRPVTNFSCPIGTQLRMSAPQFLTRNLYKSSSW
ncbi:piRNA biogenesis protein EXD1-like [Pelobates fuscus]|uniref:piRNA biogenesis protein EXD1-like n=1 Tax=Pelobates fuscus TaxID=191477 RepID=UPI002FE4B5E8